MGTGSTYEWQFDNTAGNGGTPGTNWDLIEATNIDLSGLIKFKVDDSLFEGTISPLDSFVVATGTITASSFTYEFILPEGWNDDTATLTVSVDGESLVLTGLSTTPAVLPGDTNLDGVVDAVDYIAVKTNFGLSGGEEITRLMGDLIDNNVVDWDDLQELMNAMATRSVGGAPAAAPEPATLGLLALLALSLPKRGALAVIRRRRVRKA
jgi:hypothetical protein